MPACRLLSCLLLFLVACSGAGTAFAGDDVVAQVRARGELRCGVADGIPGFAERDAAGEWRGLEVDYCRALAAAVLGDAKAVDFVPLPASKRFPALKLGRIDVLLADTSWTLTREAVLGVRFAAALFHDGQSFLVPAASPAQDPRDLKGQEICVEKDTLHAARLRSFAGQADIAIRVREAPSASEAAADFFAGRCAALSTESALLAALRHGAGRAAADYRLLPRQISNEVLSAVVANGDPAWETVVRWVAYALLVAEENALDAARARELLAGGSTPDLAQAWGVRTPDGEDYGLVARTLGIEPGWLTRAVAASGNYREVFERNLGAASPLALERGPNRLARDGGLFYAPPLR